MNNDLIVVAVNHNIQRGLHYEVVFKGNNINSNFDDTSVSHLSEWIDTLGEESAKAQNLKQSITSYKKLIDERNDDKIYIIVKTDDYNDHNWIAVGFVRLGTKDLWFADRDNTNLRQFCNCFCILDFYVRNQRQGLGYFLISLVMKSVSTPAAQFAYDRPTKAMLTFLDKHFGLSRPLPQHNHFIIFENFF
ncbi:alpha-tubulin N-acetyltransferase-like [Oppia nitens]|uniref:alpha-tubulin N-acetyltransferase-like n=1 Tax=Oppia nitens TaxID=1686743 RepID=UPI0023DC6BB9|nr:alpha-tubulin N-acetyltransferase-like [Oppia nitens]